MSSFFDYLRSIGAVSNADPHVIQINLGDISNLMENTEEEKKDAPELFQLIELKDANKLTTFLANNKDKINQVYDQSTALNKAISNRWHDGVNILLQNNAATVLAQPNVVPSVFVAIQRNDVYSLSAVLQCSTLDVLFDMDNSFLNMLEFCILTVPKRRPFHMAVFMLIVDRLVAARSERLWSANPALHGKTPLHTIAFKEVPIALQYYLEALFKLDKLRATQFINAVDDKGWTPLHFAASNKNPEMVSILLKYGADSSIVNKEEDTAIDLANDECRGLMRSYKKQLELKPDQFQSYIPPLVEEDKEVDDSMDEEVD